MDLNDWHREYLITDNMKSFAKKYDSERICVELDRFINMETKIDALNAACDRIVQASEILGQ